MAANKIRMRAPLATADRSREDDDVDEVFARQMRNEGEAADERQIRERLAEYFGILRERDLRLRHNEWHDVSEFRRP
jgi:hypothetical protein